MWWLRSTESLHGKGDASHLGRCFGEVFLTFKTKFRTQDSALQHTVLGNLMLLATELLIMYFSDQTDAKLDTNIISLCM